jgi:glutathione S-transferase
MNASAGGGRGKGGSAAAALAPIALTYTGAGWDRVSVPASPLEPQRTAMLQLHGFPMSNYFNMVKAALLEKGIEFEFVPTRPSQESDYLAKSPMGKVPCVRTDHGWLSETQVICQYLEDIQPKPALLPSNPFERAKVRELMHELELYIELPARTCYGPTFFNAKVSDEVKATARTNLTRGVNAVGKLARFSPYIAGAELSYADLIGMYSLPLAGRVAKTVWEWDLLAELPGAAEWIKTMNERPSLQKIRADQRAAG